MPIKVLDSRGSGTYADIADGIRWAADNGADVINMSLGGSVPASSMENALAYAYNKGVTIVAASGNDGKGSVSYPAAYDDYVIAVGATRFDEKRASYSNYGSSLDIVAPGGDTSVDQNGDGYGDGILQQTFGSRLNSWGYYFYQGTSMATPHVAAAAAMVKAAGIATTPSDIQSILQSSADDLGTTGRDNMYGYGLLNVATAVGAGVKPTPTPPPPPEPDLDNVPVVYVSAPQNGDTVSGTVTISADATDDNGIARVEFYVGTTLLNSDTSFSYNTTWDTTALSNGEYTITAKVFDFADQSSEDSVSVTVNNVIVPPPLPPPESDPNIILFSDGFESNLNKWTQDNQRDWRRRRQRSTDGKYSLEVDGRATNASITSVPIDLQGNSDVNVSFSWFIERRLDSGEYIAFDTSTDGGVSWNEQARLRGNVDTEDVWFNPSFDLSGISELQLRFRGTMNRGNEDADVDMVAVTSL